MITNTHMINVKNNKIMRRIEIDTLEALTISDKFTNPASLEFVVHVEKAYDYQYRAMGKE